MGVQNWKRRGAKGMLALAILILCALPAFAQGEVRITNMTVSLWPEYDKEGVLVIYRGQLADSVTLPATLRFLIPKSAGAPSSTAGVDATGQFRYRSYQTAEAGEFIAVTYTNPYREFQMEYYYNLLTVSDALRTFAYAFQADYAIDNLIVEVKQPAGAQNLSLTPVATGTGTDFDKLPLQKYTVGALGQGQTFQLTALYEKTDARLSAEILALPTPGTAQFEDVPKKTDNTVAYILLGAAATLLVGAVVYAVTQGRKRPKGKGRPAPAARPAKGRPESTRQPKGEPSAGYCHQCGARLRKDAQFCAKCGAKVKRH